MNAPGRAEVVEHRDAQRAALLRVGGRAQLVQQHQRIRRHVQRHLADVRDVRRKRAQALLDRLVVADVRQHLLEQRELGLRRRHRQPRLRHQRQQPHGLQRHRLAAGVGAADQQGAALLVQLQAERHHRAPLPPQHVLEQRMARVPQAAGARRSAGSRNRTPCRSAPWRRAAPAAPASSRVSPDRVARSRAAAPSARAGCGAPRASPLRSAAPARCSGRWFRAARRTACGRWRWRRGSRRRACRRCPAITGTTKRSLRMVTNSSCSTPSSRCARRKRSSDS